MGYRELEMPADDSPLFDDEDAPALPEPPVSVELNWPHLRQRFAAHDMASIQMHCVTHQADFETVLTQLETGVHAT